MVHLRSSHRKHPSHNLFQFNKAQAADDAHAAIENICVQFDHLINELSIRIQLRRCAE